MNESVIDVCDCCGGEGVIDRGHPNDPEPDYVEKCGQCNGEGFVLQPADPAEESWMDEE